MNIDPSIIDLAMLLVYLQVKLYECSNELYLFQRQTIQKQLFSIIIIIIISNNNNTN